MVKNLSAVQGEARDKGLILGLGKSPGERNGYPLQNSPGESHGQKSLVGYSPWHHKELDRTEHICTS